MLTKVFYISHFNADISMNFSQRTVRARIHTHIHTCVCVCVCVCV